MSGFQAFAAGLRRALGIPALILVAALVHIVFLRAMAAFPLHSLREALGQSLEGSRLAPPLDMSVLLEFVFAHRDGLRAWGAALPVLLGLFVLITVLMEAAILVRIRERGPLGLEQLFAAAGRRGFAFLRASAFGAAVLVSGGALIEGFVRATRWWLDLRANPSELASYRLSLAVLVAWVVVLVVTKTFLDQTKARILVEESPAFVPELFPELRPWIDRGTNVTRLAARSLGELVRHPIRTFSVTLLNLAVFIFLLLLLRPILGMGTGWAVATASFLQHLLLTFTRYSFLAGQLSLVESTATPTIRAARQIEPRIDSQMAPAVGERLPVPAARKAEPAVIPEPVTEEPAFAPMAEGTEEEKVEKEEATAEAKSTEEKVEEEPAEEEFEDEPSSELFIASLPERLPDSTEVPARDDLEEVIRPTSPAPAESAEVAESTLPEEEPLLEEPAAEEATAEEMDEEELARELFADDEEEPEQLPAEPPPAQPAVEFTMDEEIESEEPEQEEVSEAIDLDSADAEEPVAEEAPVEPPVMEEPPAEAPAAKEEEAAATMIVRRSDLEAQASPPPTPPTPRTPAAPAEIEIAHPEQEPAVELEIPKRLEDTVPAEESVGPDSLFGDMLEEAKEVAKTTPAPQKAPRPAAPPPIEPPPPPQAPAPVKAPAEEKKAEEKKAEEKKKPEPAAEPKLTVKDIFGDILDELGGELPESERDKD